MCVCVCDESKYWKRRYRKRYALTYELSGSISGRKPPPPLPLFRGDEFSRRPRPRNNIVVVVGNAETRGASRYEKTTPLARVPHEWRACNSVTPVRDQTVGRRAAYLYTLRARRPVERRRSCRVVSRREEPKARSLSLPLSTVRPRRQLHLPRAAATTRHSLHSPLGT